MRDFLDKVSALRRARQPFATAIVVGRQPPVSAHLGDRAIVYGDGRMEGFVGGACSREIVRRQALEAIRARSPRLVSIRPDAPARAASDPEHVFVPMTCVSEGAVDVYVEPNVRPRRLVIVGDTPVADALARAGVALDYEVVHVVDERELRDREAAAASLGVTVVPLAWLGDVVREAGGDAAAVVASQGHYDEQALETVLRSGAAYVGLVASRTRGATVRQWLEEQQVPGADTVRNPAGLDLGARTPPEVALSILAEIVQRRPEQGRTLEHTEKAAASPMEQPGSEIAIDPVCSMEVEIATASHTAEVNGTRYYFCCAHCRSQFLRDPGSFLASAS
jgi:xanthine dehydrogenase accessory factor